MIVNQAELLDVVGTSAPTVREWVLAGMPCLQRGDKGSEARYDTVAVIEWLQRRAATDDNARVKSHRERLVRAQADKAELEMAELRGELLRWSDVRPIIARQLVLARESLLNLADRVTPMVAAVAPDRKEIFMVLDAEHRGCMRHVAAICDAEKNAHSPTPHYPEGTEP